MYYYYFHKPEFSKKYQKIRRAQMKWAVDHMLSTLDLFEIAQYYKLKKTQNEKDIF